MTYDSKGSVLFIVGPTAIGKTRLSILLAKCLKSEIVSCDSMQVYKGMHILSQAPSCLDRRNVKHHLIGSLSPDNEYSVAAFRKKATILIKRLARRGKVPIVVGGSGLYVKALVDGLFPSPEADMAFRAKMERLGEKYGRKYLHKKLLKIDPESAQKIHPHDMKRIIRALEIYDATNKTMAELKSQTRGLKDEYNVKMFGLIRPRDELYEQIDKRVDKMFDDGLVGEVRKLKANRLSRTASTVLGLREVSGYLDGSYDMATAKELLKKNTRRFAKRQLTWFRADKRIKWFDVSKSSGNDIVKKIMKSIKRSRR